MDKNRPLEPIWVTDPITRKSVNVAPFLEALNTFDARPDLALNAGGVVAVRRVIRRLNLTVHDRDGFDYAEMVGVYHDLHIIEDMFEQTRTQIDE